MQTNKRNPLGLGKNLDEWINASLSRGVLQQIQISLPNLGLNQSTCSSELRS